MEQESPLAVVAAWQEAVNERDEARLLALSAPEIEIVGPRGVAQGHALLREWLHQAGLSLYPLRGFARGERVVVAQHGVWRTAETGEIVAESELGSYFQVQGGQVVRLARFANVEEALAEAGLGMADEVELPR